MEYINVILASLLSIVVLFLLSKLMGNREMSQLSLFDYANSITIGSIAAELATSPPDEIFDPLIAMAVYALAVFTISVLTNKSIKIRRFIMGKAVVLFDGGKIFEGNMRKAHLNVNEFLTQCRNQGYFNLDDIQTVLLETNGKLSILPNAQKRPLNPNDLQLQPQTEGMVTNIIIDGEIMPENLKSRGLDEKWLDKQLKANDSTDISKIMLATCDINSKLSVYKKKHSNPSKDTAEM